jgi:fibronectin-binding autotransporter adhesin
MTGRIAHEVRAVGARYLLRRLGDRGGHNHGGLDPVAFGFGRCGTCSLSSPTTWALGSSGSWTVDGNWTPATFPNSSGTNVCIVDGVSTVTLSANVSVDSLQLASGNGLTVNSGFSQLNVFGTQIINAGAIKLNGGGGSNGTIDIAASSVTLSGGGTLTMAAGGGGNAFVEGNGSTLINVDNTIQGVGVIGGGSLAVVNGGTIDANTTAGYGSLSLNGTGGISNSNGTTGGLLEATNGGILGIATTVNNAGGNITVGDSSSAVQLNGATIQGGTLNNTASGTMASLGSATLDGST